jgi:hypothetical protein
MTLAIRTKSNFQSSWRPSNLNVRPWPGLHVQCLTCLIGGALTQAHLQGILQERIDLLSNSMGTPEYGNIKPMDLIIITDGELSRPNCILRYKEPNWNKSVIDDDIDETLQSAVQLVKDAHHHPNAVYIQFIQIGDDEGATTTLTQMGENSYDVSISCCLTARLIIDFPRAWSPQFRTMATLSVPKGWKKFSFLGYSQPPALRNESMPDFGHHLIPMIPCTCIAEWNQRHLLKCYPLWRQLTCCKYDTTS